MKYLVMIVLNIFLFVSFSVGQDFVEVNIGNDIIYKRINTIETNNIKQAYTEYSDISKYSITKTVIDDDILYNFKREIYNKNAEIFSNSQCQVRLFPNPLINYARVESEGLENARLYIYDLLGNIVFEKNNINDEYFDLDLSELKLNNGTYLLRLINNNNICQTIIQIIK